MAFNAGDRIRFPDPLENDEIVPGKFHEVAVDEPLEVPTPDGGTRKVDAAWVSREDGTTARVPVSKIKPADDAG